MIVPADWTPDNSIIKVIGVGGGGCNAVTYMYNQEIQGCSFIICNTDSQVLQKSNVPIKIQMGAGLGAGTDPIAGRNAALESQDEIRDKILNTNTKMLFITAGMGGGTGTGASPVIAKLARDAGILTVAVVTIPFRNEGNESHAKAIDGIRELEQNVDSLLLIDNQKLYEHYGNTMIQDAFPMADDVLATAVRGIIEIINKPGFINVDFRDVTNMMRDSGKSLMGCGTGTGESRLEDAVKQAFEYPLLSDYDLKTAKNLLINITAGNNAKGLLMKDLSKIDTLIENYVGSANKFKRGIILEDDPDFADRVNITAIATGIDIRVEDINDMSNNIIVIDENFTYEDRHQSDGEEISLPTTPYVHVVGSNSSDNQPHFNYTEKPVLCVGPGDNLSGLENTSAYKRSKY